MIEQKININEEPKKNLEMYQALLEVDQQERRIQTNQGYTRAYIISLIFPPLGIYYFFKYLFFAQGTNDDIKAAVISLMLTVAAIVLSIWSLTSIFQQMIPASSSPSLELLKKSASPANIQELIKLYE